MDNPETQATFGTRQRMDNPETQATFDTKQSKEKIQHRKVKR